MYVSQRRTERNHIQFWVFLGEKTAFQACVNTSNNRFFTENLLVGVYCRFGELAVGIHLPSRITIVLNDFCACQLEYSFNRIALIVEIAHHIAALRSKYFHFCFTGFHHGDVA